MRQVWAVLGTGRKLDPRGWAATREAAQAKTDRVTHTRVQTPYSFSSTTTGRSLRGALLHSHPPPTRPDGLSPDSISGNVGKDTESKEYTDPEASVYVPPPGTESRNPPLATSTSLRPLPEGPPSSPCPVPSPGSTPRPTAPSPPEVAAAAATTAAAAAEWGWAEGSGVRGRRWARPRAGEGSSGGRGGG